MAGNRPPTYYDPDSPGNDTTYYSGNPGYESTYPYSNPKNLFGDGIAGFFDYIFGYSASQQANAFSGYAQEDSQQHDKDMAYLTMDLQQQARRENMLNDPSLMAEGLKKTGLSDAAVAQALTGNAPTGAIPNPHGGSAGMASGSMANNLGLGQALLQLPLQIAQARLANSQASFTDTQNDWFPKLTRQQIDESAARIRQKDKELGFTERESNSRVALNNILWNKTYEEIKSISKDIEVKQAQINRWAHENDLTDAQKLEAFERAVLAQKQGNVADAQVGLIHSETNVADSQAAVNWETADFKRMENDMYEMKLGLATLLGMPLGSDEVSVAFESMCTGNFGMYNDVIQTNMNSLDGAVRRNVNSTLHPMSSDDRTRSYYKKRRVFNDRNRSPYVHYHW